MLLDSITLHLNPHTLTAFLSFWSPLANPPLLAESYKILPPANDVVTDEEEIEPKLI